jgi:hypothetical protein
MDPYAGIAATGRFTATSLHEIPICRTQSMAGEMQNRLVDSSMPLISERRKRLRVKLEWSTRLARQPGGPSIESRTVDVSSSGFYCICDERFEMGEVLWCKLMAPSRNPLSREEWLCLDCRVKVVRVNTIDEGTRWGIACSIEDYGVMPVQLVSTPLSESRYGSH